MNSKTVSVLCVAAVILLTLVYVNAQNSVLAAAPGRVQLWEHLAFAVVAADAIGGEDTSRQIIKLGNEGWELVDVESFVESGTTMKFVYCFKRPK